MDPHPDPRGLSSERGFITAQMAAIAALSMLFLVMVLNLVAVQYAAGVVRAALDEGVRRAAPAPAGVADCLAGTREVLAGLLGGPMGEGVTISCEVGEVVRAGAVALFPPWLPGIPPFRFQWEVTAVKESAG